MNQPRNDAPAEAFVQALPGLVLVSCIFLLNFLSRIVLSPLMPAMEQSMGFSHAEAGRTFLFLAVGVAAGLLLNGHVSRRLTHRLTIVVSAVSLGLLMVLASLSPDLVVLQATVALYGLGAGLYLPSGIATVTSLVKPADWGKALSVHELAPNMSFILGPLLAELSLHLASWRTCLAGLGLVLIVSGLAFARFGRGGRFPGRALRLGLLREIVGHRSFWILALFFGLAVGSSIGPFSMLPLALVEEHGFLRPEANAMLSVARIGGLLMSLLSGYITDRLGVKRTLALFFIFAGAATVGLGLASGPWITPMVVVQASLSSCYFPAGFTALSRIFDEKSRSAAVSLITPLAALCGLGAAPAMLGWLAESWGFGVGFSCLGLLLASGVLLVRALPLDAVVPVR